VTKWDVDALEAFAAEMHRLSDVFKDLAARAPEIVTGLMGGKASLDDVAPVYRPTVQGVQQSLDALRAKVQTLSDSLTRDAGVISNFAKDAAETDSSNSEAIKSVDEKV